jgi:2-polyprenyl-3-methyl-5-hydroxy-6-metoxy-1,4-benzoquinol methylase
MPLHRVALIFDSRPRPETTGTYCLRALRQLAEVQHFLPSAAPAIPRTGFDLYLRIDDGLDCVLPPDLHPLAWWAIDTHLDFDRCLRQAAQADHVFAAQRDGAEQLRQRGIADATWLPLACDPEVHCKHDIPKTHDLAFVGHIFPGPRADLLALLQQHFPNTFVGQRYFEDMARTYSKARIVFNRSVGNDVNMRVFEALASGSLLLTNDLRGNGQAELFREGVHLATYREAEEVVDKTKFYLAREELRERIAAAGRAAVLAAHTYRHRMKALIGAVEKINGCRSYPLSSELTGSPRMTAPGEADRSAAAPPPVNDPRDLEYFGCARPELLSLIPGTARKVLDVGCGTGRLGETLKARQAAEVVGIEYDERAADSARRRLDRVVVSDVEALAADGFPADTFDVVVCGDVLEHLREPGQFLRRVRDWLQPEGQLIASIPNVRHHSVVNALLAGNWTYETAGLLDRTHLRFFTRRTIGDLFHLAGFAVRSWSIVPGPGYPEWQQQGRPAAVHIGRLQVSGLAPEDAEEFFVYQYLVTAAPVRPSLPAPVNCPPSTLRQHGNPESPPPSRGPLRFTQDFIRDFEQFDFHGRPFAFTRFADGERALCMGQPINGCDGWTFPGGDSRLADQLNEALRFAAPDYYLGISDSCCDRAARDWYLQQIRVPLDQITFANIFVNWNYRRFRQLDLRRTVLVASQGGDFTVPADILATPFDLDALVDRLLTVDRPILVSAGPAAEIIIHKYWQRAVRKQTIVDVGSAVDERCKGYRTRPYQQPGTRTGELICRW